MPLKNVFPILLASLGVIPAPLSWAAAPAVNLQRVHYRVTERSPRNPEGLAFEAALALNLDGSGLLPDRRAGAPGAPGSPLALLDAIYFDNEFNRGIFLKLGVELEAKPLGILPLPGSRGGWIYHGRTPDGVPYALFFRGIAPAWVQKFTSHLESSLLSSRERPSIVATAKTLLVETIGRLWASSAFADCFDDDSPDAASAAAANDFLNTVYGISSNGAAGGSSCIIQQVSAATPSSASFADTPASIWNQINQSADELHSFYSDFNQTAIGADPAFANLDSNEKRRLACQVAAGLGTPLAEYKNPQGDHGAAKQAMFSALQRMMQDPSLRQQLEIARRMDPIPSRAHKKDENEQPEIAVQPALPKRDNEDQVQSIFREKNQGCAIGTLTLGAPPTSEPERNAFQALFPDAGKKSYTLLARFSTGSWKSKADILPDSREMHIQLFRSKDPANGAETPLSFNLSDNPALFGHAMEEFSRFMNANVNPTPAALEKFLKSHPDVAGILTDSSFSLVPSLTQLDYASSRSYAIHGTISGDPSSSPVSAELELRAENPDSKSISLMRRMNQEERDEQWVRGAPEYLASLKKQLPQYADPNYLGQDLTRRASAGSIRFTVEIRLKARHGPSEIVRVGELVFNPQKDSDSGLRRACAVDPNDLRESDIDRLLKRISL